MDMNIDSAIMFAAHTHQLPEHLIRAICETESSMNPWAVRYEPGYTYLVGDKLNMKLTERVMQMTSWGLMQVMGGVAREHGFTGWLPQLCDPEIGIDYGCRHLKKYWNKYQDWDDAIASYNAGSPRHLPDGKYTNQFYVDKVRKAWAAWDVKSNV